MSEIVSMHIIATIHSDFKEKFGIPRQSRLVEELEASIFIISLIQILNIHRPLLMMEYSGSLLRLWE